MTEVTMYGTQRCPFCPRAEQLLKSKGVGDLQKIAVNRERHWFSMISAITI